MGQSTSAPVNVDQLINGYRGDDKFNAIWEELKSQDYLTLKHLKLLRPGPLDLLGDISLFSMVSTRRVLNLMLDSHQSLKGVVADLPGPLSSQTLSDCIEAVVCYPGEEITGPVGMEYRAIISGVDLLADVDIKLNEQHIIQVTRTAKEESFSNLLHCAAIRYINEGKSTQYITKVNTTSGTVHCWEINFTFYSSGRALQFLEGSVSRYHQRIQDDREYWD